MLYRTWPLPVDEATYELEFSIPLPLAVGHTHRADVAMIQNVWREGDIIQARSAGCLCRPIPLYGTGRPVEWINSFILGYLGRCSDSLYTIPITGGRCILPCGKEVAA